MLPQGTPTDAPASHEDVPQPVRWPWRLFFVFLGLFVLTARGHTGSVDEESLLYVSARLTGGVAGLLNIRLSIPEPARLGTEVFTTYEPGQPALAIPFYLAGSFVASFVPIESHTYITRLVVTLFGAIVTAATVARLYQLGRALGQGSGAATFMAATYAIGTLAWPYARTFFREPLVAFALVSGAYALVRWREHPNLRLALSGWGWVLLAVLTKLAALFAVPVFVAYVASIYLKHRRRVGGPNSTIPGEKVLSRGRVRVGVIAAVVVLLIVAVGGFVLQNRWTHLRPYRCSK